MPLNEKQVTAIKQLESAFLACKKAGLSFCGMDNNLYAYDAEDLTETEKRLGCLYDAQLEMQDSDSRHIVKTKGSYLDSGGW